MKFVTNSLEETQQAAAKIAKKITGKTNVVALIGELGAGKTTFVQGFAKALGVTDKIISPTFIVQRQHPIPDTGNVLYHIDLYRLDGQLSLEQLGLTELFADPKAIILIEWAQKIDSFLPDKKTVITFEKISENKRLIKVT